MKRSIETRRGFTLIELLVTMLIMSIMGVAMAMVMSGAEDSARIAKTRSLIARLHTLVMQKYESYRTRRLPVAIPAKVLSNGNPIVTPPRTIAKARCDVIRQLMRLEMPDRWTDISDDPVPIYLIDPQTGATLKDPNNSSQPAYVQMTRPACNQAYLAFWLSVKDSATFQQHGAEYQGAKCLYLLVTMGLDDADVMENFSEGDIADFDKTGCKVFLDAWGNPIRFLRWAPGFVSYLQPAKPGTNGIAATARDLRMPDQTDPTGIYGVPQNSTTATAGKPDTFALYPLIYSAGPDGNYDIVSDMNSGNQVFHYSTTTPPNNPYASVTDTTNFPDGAIGSAAVFPAVERNNRSTGDTDNIHNHLIGAR